MAFSDLEKKASYLAIVDRLVTIQGVAYLHCEQHELIDKWKHNGMGNIICWHMTIHIG